MQTSNQTAAAAASINIGKTKNLKQRTMTNMDSETTPTKRSMDTAGRRRKMPPLTLSLRKSSNHPSQYKDDNTTTSGIGRMLMVS
jgi:hypothetical protein